MILFCLLLVCICGFQREHGKPNLTVYELWCPGLNKLADIKKKNPGRAKKVVPGLPAMDIGTKLTHGLKVCLVQARTYSRRNTEITGCWF